MGYLESKRFRKRKMGQAEAGPLQGGAAQPGRTGKT